MPAGASPKRERQYEHIKQSAKKSGRYGGRAEEVAARTVNKIRREKGETKAQRGKKSKKSSSNRSGSSSPRRSSSSRARSSSASRSRTTRSRSSSSSRGKSSARRSTSSSRRTASRRTSGSRRGFAGMSDARQRQIAAQGGRAAHKQGTAHEFSTTEARQAGQKGGVAVSRNRSHMAEIGRRGGER